MGQVAGALAIAVVGAVVASTTVSNPTPAQSQHGYNMGFLACAIGTLCAVGLGLRLPTAKRAADLPDDVALAAE